VGALSFLLLSGGKAIVLPKTATRDFNALRNILKSEKVTILNQTPSAFYALSSEEKNHEDCLSVRTVILGGEALNPSLLRYWKEKYPECTLINMYGITETTVHSTYKEITINEIQDGLSNIGRSLPTDKIYIVDDDANVLPQGVTGEIYVAGKGVGRGYLNQEQLTAEKFIMNPRNSGERMYKSGDLAYVAPNGDVVYVGRRDNQIQLKGFRVELDEVNKALGQHPAVKKSVILVKTDKNGNDCLCGYVVLKMEISSDELKDHVRQILPYYMVPSVIVQLDELPLTENGKIDKKALRLLDVDRSKIENNYWPPRNKLEQFLVAIWRDALDWKNIGIYDDLFLMGADSIKLIHIISKIIKAGYKITIQTVFNHPTIAELSGYLEKENPDHELIDGIIPLPVEPDGHAADKATKQKVMIGEIPFTVSQKEFLDTKIAHNWTGAFVLEAFDEGINLELLEKACRLILERHDILRAQFIKDSRGWKQILASPDEVTLPVRYLDYSAFSDEEQLEKLESLIMSSHSVMDLAKPPLLDFTLVNRGKTRGSFLFILAHHLIFDGLSMSILLEDISHMYTSLMQGTAAVFQDKPLAIYKWIDIVANFVNGGGLGNEVQYWSRAFENKIGQLRVDFPENMNRNRINTSAYYKINLSVEQTKALGRGIPAHEHMPVANLLIAGLTLAVAEYSRNEWILMEVIDSGRGLGAELGVDLSRTVGWLSHSHNLLLRVDKRITDKKSALISIVNQIQQAPVNDIRLLHYHKDEKRKEILRTMPKTPVCFNYLGTRKSTHVSSNQIEDFANNIRGKLYWIHPENERPNVLGCNTEIVNDELIIIFDYSHELHKEETIIKLTESYLEYLRPE
jgi:aryl carrier-like protein